MKKVKLFFMINTLRGGGAEKALINLLNQLNSEDYEVTLLSVEGGVFVNEIPKHVHHYQLVGEKDSFANRIKKKIIYHMPSFVFRSLFIKGKFDYEIAYLEGFSTKILSSRRSQTKTIAFVHCDIGKHQAISKSRYFYSKITKYYKRFHKVCFVSKDIQQSFETSYIKLDNACVIHNIINKDEIVDLSKLEPSFIYSTLGMKIISIGRLEQVKGFKRLLNVIKKLEDEFVFELVILGDGSEYLELKDEIVAKKIRSVKMLGFQKNPYPILAQSDLFLCSSYTEGYSTVVNESLLLGVPILTTDCSGMKEIFNNGKEGIIVDNSEMGIENGLRKILNDKDFYSSLKSQAIKYSEINSNEIILNQIKKLFNQGE